ncbi:MAG: T9SS type A sorting domain-containing protein [Saprospiraceae bacterium]|nr:T9SS type A sorting domain-containing protein [Saprospiraceae bacterium]
MRNYIFGSLVLTYLCCQGVNLCAQTGPTCRDINLPVQVNDSVNFQVQDFVSNAADAQLLTIQVMNPFNGVLLRLEDVMADASIELPACRYVGKELNIMAGNAGGWCNTVLTFTQSHLPVIRGRSDTVLCNDPLVSGGHINGSPPLAEIPCEPDKPAEFVSDWAMKFPCEADSDPAKVILRSYAAMSKDGIRTMAMDTITVTKLPAISLANTYCAERDTTFCGDPPRQSGPFMMYENPKTGMCETLFFLNGDGSARTFDELCGLQVKVDELFFPSDCGTLKKVTVQIKQSCPGTPDACTVPSAGNVLTGGDGYWTCTYWHMELDTVGPIVSCGMELQTLPTNSHSCETQLPLPPVTAIDLCHDVTLVKARIANHGTVTYERQGDLWVSSQPITIPMTGDSIEVIFEAFDVCHNVGYDTCHFKVIDQTAPIAVAEKRVNVNMSGKKAWVSAESFNESSWDNCDVSLVLARRTDWQESCIDLCNNLALVSPLGNGDSLWRAVLGGDSLVDLVEQHYQETINWLVTDGQSCGPLVSEAWHYALLKYATVTCKQEMSAADFDILVDDYLNPALDPVQVKQIGGGWSFEVPISCEDICNPVQVELLVMDYWCNWSRSWSEAWIDDKGALDIAKDVPPSIEISCKSFRDLAYEFEGQASSLSDLTSTAEMGDAAALEQLDQVFGTYQSVWRNDQGQLTDAEGNFVDLDIPFTDSICRCIDTMITKTVYDSLLGWIETTVPGRYCFYEAMSRTYADGAIVVSCPDNLHMDQKVSSLIDDCGQGWIERTWKLWKACEQGDELYVAGTPDTTIKKQKIWVGNQCGLDSGMFVVPDDAEIEVCILEYDGSGNVIGAADPDSTGRPEYIFDDDCRLVGIGHFDKVLSVINDTSYCYKIIRTWCFADWCATDKPTSDAWPDDDFEGTTLKYVQTILVRCTCTCMINCAELRDTSIACEDVPVDLTTLYSLFNMPTIFHPIETESCDDFSLENTIRPDVNVCGSGTISNTWYLVNSFGMRVDSCNETITLLPGSFEVSRPSNYRGDAEPFNCSDSIVLDPVEVIGACPRLEPIIITNDSPFAENSGNDASGNYDVGVHFVNYTITDACGGEVTLTDTVTVIDDVNPTVTAFSDGCVFFQEWADDFNNDPTDMRIRSMLAVTGNDNCPNPVVDLLGFTADSIPSNTNPDSIIFRHQWQATDMSGLQSAIVETFIVVSDLCNNAARRDLEISADDLEIVRNTEKEQMGDKDLTSGRLRKVSVNKDFINEGTVDVYQNRPNPFNTRTMLSFNLPEAADVRISIFDVTGKTLKIVQEHFGKGYQEVMIEKAELQTSGIVYYRLETNQFTATRKMVVLD